MSTAEQIIADVLGEHGTKAYVAAHVVAALTNAGKTIVELPEAENYAGDSQWTLRCGTVSVDSRKVVSFEGDDICDAIEAPEFAAALLAAARVAEGGERRG